MCVATARRAQTSLFHFRCFNFYRNKATARLGASMINPLSALRWTLASGIHFSSENKADSILVDGMLVGAEQAQEQECSSQLQNCFREILWNVLSKNDRIKITTIFPSFLFCLSLISLFSIFFLSSCIRTHATKETPSALKMTTYVC